MTSIEIFKAETFHRICGDFNKNKTSVVNGEILGASTFNMMVQDIYNAKNITRSRVYQMIEDFESDLISMQSTKRSDLYTKIMTFENTIATS